MSKQACCAFLDFINQSFMKRLFYFAYLLLLTLTVNADDRSMGDMQAIAAQKLYGAQAKAWSPSVSNTPLDLLVDDQAYCVFGAGDAGFVIVSRDDMFEPVLAYSTKPFPKDDMPCGMKWWMDVTSENLQAMKAAGITPAKAPFRTISPVANFVPSEWGQEAPYNNNTPLVDNTKTPTGCLATATAQILYYYRYPVQGTGEGWYTLGASTYQNPVTINTTYAWDLMKDTYSSLEIPFLSPEQKEAIGKLMFECGAGVKMSYDKGGSGAYSVEATNAFIDNFLFDPLATKNYARDYYTEEEWLNLVWTELENKRPILYGGVDPVSGGHAFVFSGVDEDGKVYVNWGWDGAGNGFFSLNDLCPQGILGSSSSTTYHFNNAQEMVCGFRTDPVPTADEYFSVKLGTTDDYEIKASDDPCSINHTLKTIYNFDRLSFKGGIGIYLEQVGNPEQNYFHAILSNQEVNKIDPATGWIYGVSLASTSLFSISLSSLPAGTYTAYAASKDERDVKPQMIRVEGVGPRSFTVTIADDRTVTVSEPQITTAINAVTVTKPVVSDNNWYTIDGQRLNGEPTQRGIYIHNGQKFVVK